MTQWSPDTCGCEIEYDDDLKVVAVHKKCAKHADTVDDAIHFDTVLAHNRKKNAAHNAVVAHLKSLGMDHERVHTGYDVQDNLIVRNSKLSVADQQMVAAAAQPAIGASAIKFEG
jgi:hypothetical protein